MTDRRIPVCIDRDDFGVLFETLKQRGYSLVGPTVRDGAIIYDHLHSPDDLPIGVSDEQDAATYRLRQRDDQALFGFNVGPHSWKKFLFPPRSRLWQAHKTETGFEIEVTFDHGVATSDNDQQSTETAPAYAFIGVRACELQAIHVQDRVFIGDQHHDPRYQALRNKAFIVAVNCGQAAKTCFCSSMKTGPKVSEGYDLELTEILDDGKHYFVAAAGSDEGAAVLAEIPHNIAEADDLNAAVEQTEKAEKEMGRHLDLSNIKEMLTDSYHNTRWDDIAERCLSCANCTMVCPTCFCSKVEDNTDLTGDHAERWRSWDSCFSIDFSYIHGGSIRTSVKSRYRQWMTHKLATWIDQFGTSGCVGCGRCITWCPVGIDITEEVEAMRNS